MFGNRDLNEWLGEGAALIQKQKKQHIKQDSYDSTIFKEIRKTSQNIKELERAGPETFIPLVQDIWAEFYKAAPELENENDMDFAHRITRPFIERVVEDQETKNTRITTMLDELSAAVATIGTAKTLLKEINEREELKEAFKKADDAAVKMENQEKDEAEELMVEAEKQIQGAARDVRRAIREAVRSGQEQAGEVQEAMAGWGIESAEMKKMPIGDRLSLADTITYYGIKKISDLVGRMRNLARARQKNVLKKRQDEIHSITIGSDIPHILPQELGAMRHPLRKLDFYRRFTEGQLLQYDLKQQEKQAKGPMVIMVDISGSMEGPPIEWAISCALALVDTASRQKRYAHVLFFDTEVKKEFNFAPGEKSLEKYLEMARIGPAGGTDYTEAINRSMEIISEDKNFEKADMVMITDGQCLLPVEYLNSLTEWKKQTNTTCYSILIDSAFVIKEKGGLQDWNDQFWMLNSFEKEGDAIAGELFELIS